MSAPTRRFSTGLPFLDRRIDGGIEAGGLVTITAPPESQSELFLREFARTHKTFYLSTVRPEAEIREWLTSPITEIDVAVTTVDPPTVLEKPATALDRLPPESFFVLDIANSLEAAPRDRYLAFLNHLKRVLRERDSVGILHCIEEDSSPPRRTLTLNRSDTVWQLRVMVHSREIKNQLVITKARNSRALTEPIDLRLTDSVRVDTSRRIG